LSTSSLSVVASPGCGVDVVAIVVGVVVIVGVAVRPVRSREPR
jgi:hypothetical protein